MSDTTMTTERIRHRVRLRRLLYRYLPRVYLQREIQRVRDSQWLTDEEKENRVWVLRHTIPIKGHRDV